MAILRVEPLTTARALRGPFDYRQPEAMAELEVGSVVRVPFGPRRLLGVVVELAEASELPPERLAEPIEALEAGAPPELVRLGLWVAREYCSTPSRGLQLVLPPGTGAGAASTVRAQARAAGGDPARRRGGAERRRAARASSSGPCWRRCARARCRRAELAAAVGADRADPAPPRGSAG